MNSQTVKTAISLPQKDFARVEAMRKRLRWSRSELFLVAFRCWLSQKEKEDREAAYTAGYAKYPENIVESEGLVSAGLTLWENNNAAR